MTELLRSRYDIRTVQELLGHADVTTTMVYTHVLNAAASASVVASIGCDGAGAGIAAGRCG